MDMFKNCQTDNAYQLLAVVNIQKASFTGSLIPGENGAKCLETYQIQALAIDIEVPGKGFARNINYEDGIKPKKMNIKSVVVFGSFTLLYLVLAVAMLVKNGMNPAVFQHTVLVWLSMVCMLWLIKKIRSDFFKLFSIVAVVYYIVACFGSVVISLFRSNYLAFENMGVLARTEGFLAFTLVGFIVASYRTGISVASR